MDIIEKRTKLYRVGRRNDADGLWYDKEGNFTGLIHTVPNAVAAGLPMGVDPIFRVDGRKWISVTDTIAMLGHWFSKADMQHLIPRGYEVMEIEVDRYRRFFFEGFQHEVYSKEDAVGVRTLDPSLVYGPI